VTKLAVLWIFRTWTEKAMKLLAYLTESFIATFGITRPRPEQERLANIVIGGFLLTFGIAVLGLMGFLFFQMSAGGHSR
jgi:hypothetical protein